MTTGKPYPREYDFDDWMEYDLYSEKILDTDEQVLNDSSKYSWLKFAGKLTYDVWNKIQDAQKETYYKMRDFEFSLQKDDFIKDREKLITEFGRNSSRIEEFKKLTLKRVRQYIDLNPNVKEDVLRKPHRQMPYGAKYITPRYVKEFQNYQIGSNASQLNLSAPYFEAHRYNTIPKLHYNRGDMFPGQLDILVMDAWLMFEDWLTNMESQNLQISILNLKDLLKAPEDDKLIKGLLVENGYCQEETFMWKDDAGGYKKPLVGFIKHLHLKGFTRKKPTDQDCVEVAKNTFGIELSFETAKKVRANDFNYPFIPART